jgi:hypothetical protein
MFASLRRSAYAVTGSKLPTAVAQRPLRKTLQPYYTCQQAAMNFDHYLFEG